jgi:hypothetical protein
LEHPGIVPVYGLGQYADGRPYYAMRFIKGDNLKDAIERFHKAETPNRDQGERTLEFRKLLRRFQDVCNDPAQPGRLSERQPLRGGGRTMGKPTAWIAVRRSVRSAPLMEDNGSLFALVSAGHE